MKSEISTRREKAREHWGVTFIDIAAMGCIAARNASAWAQSIGAPRSCEENIGQQRDGCARCQDLDTRVEVVA
jgi:hypothetical protein